MALADREVARFVLDDLAENAAKAGAMTVSVDLRYSAGRYHAAVTDDGPGLRKGPGCARVAASSGSRSCCKAAADG